MDNTHCYSENSKRIAKNTLLLYFRMLLTVAVSLFTSRVILDSLGAEDYGIYDLVGGFVTMFHIVRAGLLSATQRFITFDLGKGDLENLKETFSACLFIFVAISFFVLISAESFGIWFIENKLSIPSNRIFAAQWVFQLSLITLIVNLVSYPYTALIIAHERMKAFAYISIYETMAKLGIAYALYISVIDRLVLYAILLCLIQISVRIIYSSYCGKNFIESRIKWKIEKNKIKQIYSFTGWEMFGSIASIGFTQGLNILLGMFFNPVVNAARGIAVQVQNAISGFVANFQTAINPQITKSYASHENHYLHKLIFTSSRFSYYLMLVFSLPIMLEADSILKVWLTEVPEYTVIFLRLILITTIVDAISNSIITSVEATGNIRNYQILIGGLLVFIVPLAYVVLKFGGAPYMVFVVHVIVGFIAFVIRIYMGSRIVGFQKSEYVKDVLFPILVVTIVSSIIPIILHILLKTNNIRLFVVCITSALMVSISVYYLGLMDNEKQFVLDQIRKRHVIPFRR